MIDLISKEDAINKQNQYSIALREHMDELNAIIDENKGRIYIRLETINKWLNLNEERKLRSVLSGLKRSLKDTDIGVSEATLKDNSRVLTFYRK